MLFLRRVARLEGSDAERFHLSVARPGLRMYLIGVRGLTFESRICRPLQQRYLAPTAGQLVFPLDGEFVVRDESEVVVTRGSAVTDSTNRWDERWNGTERRGFQALVFEWTEEFGPVLSRPERLTLGPRDLEKAEGLAAALRSGELRREVAARAVAGAGRWIRGLGLEVPPWPGTDETPREAQPLADALSHTLSNLPGQPMWVDVEKASGVGERNARRRLTEWTAWLGGPFRERLRLHRAVSAATLLSARNATLERISRSVGYGSPRALIRAFHDLGLATPSLIRDAIAAASAPEELTGTPR